MNILDDMVEQPTPWTADGNYLCRYVNRDGTKYSPWASCYGSLYSENHDGFTLSRSRLPLSQYVAGDKVKAEAAAEKDAAFTAQRQEWTADIARLLAAIHTLRAELAALKSAQSGTEAGELTATEINGQPMKAKSAPAPAADDGEWEDCTREECFAASGRYLTGGGPGRYQRRRVTLQTLAARVAALESRAKGGAP